MPTHVRSAFVLLILLIPAAGSPRAQAKAATQKPSCSLLSAAEIRKISGNTKVATRGPQREESTNHSNCIYWGAYDIGITVGGTTQKMFIAMRDNYKRSPALYRVEQISGLGQSAYVLYSIMRSGRLDNVKAAVFVDERELDVALQGDHMPPEAQSRTVALALAKAALARLK